MLALPSGMMTKLVRLTLLSSLLAIAACGGSAPKEGEDECQTSEDCGEGGSCLTYMNPKVCYVSGEG